MLPWDLHVARSQLLAVGGGDGISVVSFRKVSAFETRSDSLPNASARLVTKLTRDAMDCCESSNIISCRYVALKEANFGALFRGSKMTRAVGSRLQIFRTAVRVWTRGTFQILRVLGKH